jgi:hypothetical protein
MHAQRTPRFAKPGSVFHVVYVTRNPDCIQLTAEERTAKKDAAKKTGNRIDAATIDVIADGRATEHLVALLRQTLGSRWSDIRWERHGEITRPQTDQR